jgi:hypothetical protein
MLFDGGVYFMCCIGKQLIDGISADPRNPGASIIQMLDRFG